MSRFADNISVSICQSSLEPSSVGTDVKGHGSSVAQWLADWTTVRAIRDRSRLGLSLRLASSSG